MIEREEIRNIVQEVLEEEHLHNFTKIFEKEHNLFRGTHDKMAVPPSIVENYYTQEVVDSKTHWERKGDDIYYTDGNVGIKTDSPAYDFDVAGTIHASTRLQIGPTVGDANDLWEISKAGEDSHGGMGIISGDLGISFAQRYSGKQLWFSTIGAGGNISWYTTEGERMRINDSGGISIGSDYVGTDPGDKNVIISGSVGVGTTTLTKKFNINGTLNVTGAVTFGSTLGVTGAAIFSNKVTVYSDIELDSAGEAVLILDAGTGNDAYVEYQENNVTKYVVGYDDTDGFFKFCLSTMGADSRLTINGGTGEVIIAYNLDVGTIASGKITVTGGAEGLKLIGTATGNTNLCHIGFYDSNGSTRRGYVGDAASGNDDIYLTAETGDLRLLANGIVILPTGSTIGNLTLANGSIADSGGAISFGDENLSTTGTITGANLIVSQNSDTVTLSHDGSNAYVKWSDGDLALMTDEGTNANTHVSILGKGTGFGILEVYDTDEDSYITLTWKADDQPSMTCDATPTEFNFLHDRAVDIKCWSSISSGNPYFYIYGYKAAVGVKYGAIGVGSDGVLNITAEDGAISFGDENLSTTGTLGCGGPLTITQNSDTLVLSHDGTDAYFKTSDGYFIFQSDEGDNSDGVVLIKGKGTGTGTLVLLDDNDVGALALYVDTGRGYIDTSALASGELELQTVTVKDILCWSSITSGNPTFSIHGYKAAVGVKYLNLGVEADGDALILSEGNLNINAGGGEINFADENLITSGYIGLKSSAELRFYDNGNYVGFKAPALDADKIWVLPTEDGDADDFLQTDGGGNLVWAAGGGGAGDVTAAAVMTDHTIVRGDGGAKGVQDSGVTIDDSDNIVTTGTIRWSEFVHDVATDYNLFLGKNAGAAIDTGGKYNVFVGENAGQANTTGDGTVAVGYQAGYTQSTSQYCVFIGYKAGYKCTASNNFFIGYEAGLGDAGGQTGQFNTCIGFWSGKSLTSGHSNVALGYQAGWNLTSGYTNFLMGSLTGRYITTGYLNVMIGASIASGVSATAPHQNVFIGGSIGPNITSANRSVAIGVAAGNKLTSGYYNTLIGNTAGWAMTSGHTNTIIGRAAGFNLATGTGNVFIGYQAGFNEAGSKKLYIANTLTATPLIYGEFDNGFITINGYLNITTMKSGANQGAAGAGANELWYTSGHGTLPDNVVMMGV